MPAPWDLLSLVVTAALAGLCWTVQGCVYPHFGQLLRSLGPEGFKAYHAAYTASMGWVAAPLMLVEFGLATAEVLRLPDRGLAWIGAGLVAFIWVHTFALMVPMHARLQREPTPGRCAALVRWNLARTLAWTLRAIVLAAGWGG
jgi:hypothetical protein